MSRCLLVLTANCREDLGFLNELSTDEEIEELEMEAEGMVLWKAMRKAKFKMLNEKEYENEDKERCAEIIKKLPKKHLEVINGNEGGVDEAAEILWGAITAEDFKLIATRD